MDTDLGVYLIFFQHWLLAIQSAICGPAVLASPGSLLAMQNLKPHPGLSKSKAAFSQGLQVVSNTSEFGNFCFRAFLSCIFRAILPVISLSSSLWFLLQRYSMMENLPCCESNGTHKVKSDSNMDRYRFTNTIRCGKTEGQYFDLQTSLN